MLIPLSNEPRAYSWGSPSLIAQLEGREPGSAPEAEVWYGDHPGCPARTPDGRTLDAVLAELGEPPLPYLVKLLAASSSLSIQAHPSKTEAARGFAREESAGIARDAASRNYRDDNHKPEIIVALSDRLRALVGLRPLDRTRALLAAIGDGARPLADRLAGDDEPAVLREAIAWALSGDAGAEIALLETALAHASSEEFAEELDVLRSISRDFPGDAGIVVAALMNLVVLTPGEALFAPAGVLHAYQDGLGVEVMAASDNVLRGGLTPKHIDVGELLRVVDTTPGAAPLVTPGGSADVRVFDVGIPDFLVRHLTLDGGAGQRLDSAGPTLVLATRGEVVVKTDADEVVLRSGRAVLAVAEDGIGVSGLGEAFVAEPGRS